MNNQLQNLFEKYYRPELAPPVEERGSSSIQGTKRIRDQIPILFKKYKINSMFDAGCNDSSWAQLIPDVKYTGGEISRFVVEFAKNKTPDLDIIQHDITSDAIPEVDLVFIRDVAIHLNDIDRKKLLANWISSGVPWLLITQSNDIKHNSSVVYDKDFPVAEVNWMLGPWNFPAPTEEIWEFSIGGRSMALWHRNQIENLL